jgi:hypothetical protein
MREEMDAKGCHSIASTERLRRIGPFRILAMAGTSGSQCFPTDFVRARRYVLADMDTDSTVLIAVVLAGVIALLVFFPWDKL